MSCHSRALHRARKRHRRRVLADLAYHSLLRAVATLGAGRVLRDLRAPLGWVAVL